MQRIPNELTIVWPVHPRTAGKMKEYGLHIPAGGNRILRIEPVGYFDMIQFLQNCRLVLTDSGGLQKEAYFFRKPCIVVRDETEWAELCELGFNRIVGTETDQIIRAFHEMAHITVNFQSGLFGCGDAGQRIVNLLTTLSRY